MLSDIKLYSKGTVCLKIILYYCIIWLVHWGFFWQLQLLSLSRDLVFEHIFYMRKVIFCVWQYILANLFQVHEFRAVTSVLYFIWQTILFLVMPIYCPIKKLKWFLSLILTYTYIFLHPNMWRGGNAIK